MPDPAEPVALAASAGPDPAIAEDATREPPHAAYRAEIALLVIILLVGTGLRLWGLDAQSLWYDEVLTVRSARVPVTQVFDAVRQHENSPPLYFALVNVWAKAFGTSEVALRLPSALLGIATLAALYGFGRDLYDRRVGLTAAALVAVSPFHVAYSQEARTYALVLLLALLCGWALVRMLRTGSVAAQVTYVATAALAMHAHTFAAFVLLALNVAYIMRWVRSRRTPDNPFSGPARGARLDALPAVGAPDRPIASTSRAPQAGPLNGETSDAPAGASPHPSSGAVRRIPLRRWLTLQAGVVVLFGPWIPATLEVAGMGLPWLIHQTPFHVAMAGYAGSFTAAAVMGALVAVAVVHGLRRRDERVLMLVLLAVLPVLGPLAVGAFTTRYGICALIGLSVLTARGAALLGRAACAGVVALAVVGWLVTSTPGHPRFPNVTPKIDVRAAVAHIAAHAGPGDGVVSDAHYFGYVFEFYYRPPIDLTALRHLPAPGAPGPQRIWLATEDPAAESAAAASDYAIHDRRAYAGVHLFELRRSAPASAASTEPALSVTR